MIIGSKMMFSGERCQISTVPEMLPFLLGFGIKLSENLFHSNILEDKESFYSHVQKDPYPSNWIIQ